MQNLEIIIKKSDIGEYLKSLPGNGPFGEKVLANSDGSVVVNKNVTSFEPAEFAEIHDNFVDFLFIEEGKEDLYIGGELQDKESLVPGEWRGKDLSGARKHEVSAGDMVIIPKGVPHQHGQGAIKMIVIKTS